MKQRSSTNVMIIGACMALIACGGSQAPEKATLAGAGDKGALASGGGDSSRGSVEISCNFENGWVAFVPQALATDDEFLMQALIGFSTDPGFWSDLEDYKKYEPYKATECMAQPTSRELEPGTYIMMVGWAGQFERTGYKNNGRIETITVEAGGKIQRSVSTTDLDKDLPCISCPFLLVMQGGTFVELGQILIDRYVATRQGTDRREARVDVENGLITVQLAEREPETSYIDAIEVWHEGKRLEPARAVPEALRAVDGAMHTLDTGDSVTLQFHAPIDSGSLPVEVRVNGYYILDVTR